MKKAFLINGLNINHTAAGDAFEYLRKAIASKGYEVVPIDISWRQTTPTQFAKKFLQIYESKKGTSNTIIGNSFGAVVALITAPRTKPDQLVLCSLSPFFKEDFRSGWPTDKQIKRLGKRRLNDISNYSIEKNADEINKQKISVKVLYGEQEKIQHQPLVDRSISLSKLISGSTLIEVANAPHSFKDQAYTDGIKNIL